MAYNPTLGRWMQQDPAGYVDGMSRLQYLNSSPLGANDPLGLANQPSTQPVPADKQDITTPKSGTFQLRDFNAVNWRIKWILPKVDGAIVQHVKTQQWLFDKNGKPSVSNADNPVHEYFEAWIVRKGKVYSGVEDRGLTDETGGPAHDSITEPPNFIDSLALFDQPKRRDWCMGWILDTVEASFVPGLKITSDDWDVSDDAFASWGPLAHRDVRNNPKRKANPPGWTGQGTLNRWIAIKWDYTQDPPDGTITVSSSADTK